MKSQNQERKQDEMATEALVPRSVSSIQRHTNNPVDLFRPTSFAEAMEFAKVLADSGMVPKAYVGKPAAIIASWQHALELGVGMMQGLQGISNINGNPAVFGDLGWALVQNHPDFVDSIEVLEDTYAECTLKRRGRSDKTRKYTLEMAKTNDLLGKDNWKKNPKRMLQWRARSWAMRDQFPDALKGMVIYEEAQDYPGVTIDAAPQTQVEPQKPADPPIGKDKAMEWFKAYKASGWTAEDARKWLAETLKVEKSFDIPASKFDEAMQWAKTPNPDK